MVPFEPLRPPSLGDPAIVSAQEKCGECTETFGPAQWAPFLGAVVYNNHIVMGDRLKKNIRIACREVMMGIRDERTVIPYMGHTKYMDSAVMLEKLFAEVGWEYEI